MNKFVPVLLSILLVISLLGFHLSLDSQLFAPDSKNHYSFASFVGCDSGYANGVCLMLGWINLSPFIFWFVFFIISMFIPLFFVLYTKNLWMFPLFFVFTGFFWQSMAMQVFAQIIVSLILVFFIFEKNNKLRWFLLILLFLIYFLGVKIHSTIFVILIFILVYELLYLFKDVLKKTFDSNKKYFCLGCGLLPVDLVKNVHNTSEIFRKPMRENTGSLFQSFFYYFYSFFIENMFIGFVIPGVYEIFNKKDFRKIYYFLFILFGALYFWFSLGWTIWGVTRVLLWLPLVLFVPFMDWLERQTKNVKLFFYLMGLFYFVFNVYYFVNRVQGMSCL